MTLAELLADAEGRFAAKMRVDAPILAALVREVIAARRLPAYGRTDIERDYIRAAQETIAALGGKS